MKHYTLILFSLIILSLGCARTITDRVTTLNLQATLTLRENVDINNVNYLMVFSTLSTPNITLPEIVNSSLQYFPTPGREYSQGSVAENTENPNITSFYEDYFYSWSDYIVIHQGTPLLYQSGSTGFNAATTENLTYTYSRNLEYDISISGKNIVLNFDISILESDLSGTRYFTFATTQISDGTESGVLVDTLDSPQSIDILINNDESNDQEQEETDIAGDGDIIAWRVEIL